MSRSNNVEIKNPSTKFIEWKGEEGKFQYYDKEQAKNIIIELPFTFLVLDVLHTIKGYSKQDKCSYYSNEVRDLKKDELVVKSFKGNVTVKGLYQTVIGDRAIVGAKYCQSVYIAMKEEGKLVIANLQLVGAAVSSFIEFRKKNNIFEGAVTVKEKKPEVNGKTEYFVPVFGKTATTPESDNAAKALDIELQAYLKAYFLRNSTTVAEINAEEAHKGFTFDTPPPPGVNDEPPMTDDDDIAPF